MTKTILHIIPTLSRGGAETLLFNTINLLQEYSHVVVTFNEVEKQMDCRATVLNINCSFPKSFFKAVSRVNSIIKDHQPLIINAHLYWAVILIRFCKTSSAKVFQWYHSDLYNSNNTEQYSLKRLLIDKLTSQPKNKLVFVSEYLKSQISKEAGIKGETFVMPNFIESRYFELVPNSIREGKLRILLVGNLRTQKNHKIVLEGLSLLPDQEIETVIVGEGPLRTQIEERIISLKLKNVVLVGNQIDISPYLSQADIFIMPSLFEGFGISLVEAMAVGLPCIVSDIPPFQEIGEQELLFFNPVSATALAEKINILLDADQRKKLGELAKTRAQKFSSTVYLNEIRKIYSS